MAFPDKNTPSIHEYKVHVVFMSNNYKVYVISKDIIEKFINMCIL
jgi:hypothetical protein